MFNQNNAIMPEGRVIDPDGGENAEEKWGYIERYDLKWPGSDQYKVIPFKNKNKEFQLDQEVTFIVDPIDPDKDKAKLAVAKNVQPKK